MRDRAVSPRGCVRSALALLAVGISLAACAEAKPFQYEPAGEMPSGPGLFTGKTGEFTLYRLDDDGKTEVLK